jgi:CheY-like chemotaxis protein
MHAPKYRFAVRLIGFAQEECAQIETALGQGPVAGPSYFCLLDDSLQEPDIYLANGDRAHAVEQLARLHPGLAQPALVIGGQPGQVAFPRLARPLNRFQLQEAFAELVEQRAQALALIAANGLPFAPERRRHVRLEGDSPDPLLYQCRRQPPPDGAVLIIDQGGAFRDHVAQLLAKPGLPVEWTDSAPAAVRLCDETRVSVVMINTPTRGIDPYGLCSEIKAQGGALRTAVLFLVGRGFHYDSARARDAGLRGLLDKPVADRHLMAALHKLLSLPS